MGKSQGAGVLLVTEPRKAAPDQQGWASKHCLDLLGNALEAWSDEGHHASLHQLNQLWLQSTDSLADEHDRCVLEMMVSCVQQNIGRHFKAGCVIHVRCSNESQHLAAKMALFL